MFIGELFNMNISQQTMHVFTKLFKLIQHSDPLTLKQKLNLVWIPKLTDIDGSEAENKIPNWRNFKKACLQLKLHSFLFCLYHVSIHAVTF